MTTRLRQRQSFSDPGMERLAELVRAVPKAASPSLAQAHRVRESLRSRRRRPRSLARRLAWLLVMSGGLAFASSWTVRHWSRPPDTRAASWRGHRPASPATLPPPPVVTPLLHAAATPPPARLPAALPTVAATARHTPPSPGAPLVAPALEAAGAPLLSASLTALRRHDDPLLADRLAAEYLSAHPDGNLIEESFALRIEAARARGATREAGEVAAAYLSRFPEGRFAAVARKALLADGR